MRSKTITSQESEQPLSLSAIKHLGKKNSNAPGWDRSSARSVAIKRRNAERNGK
jgi:hypothetical protein